MAIYRFQLRGSEVVSLLEREGAERATKAVRMALVVRGFEEHVLWPEAGVLHAILEGDDPEQLSETLDAFATGFSWAGNGFVEVPGAEGVGIGLGGHQRSKTIIRSALEGEEIRCDFCEAMNPPPHDGGCTYAKREQGLTDSVSGFLIPKSGGDIEGERVPAAQPQVEVMARG
jgi:hypothetical protein